MSVAHALSALHDESSAFHHARLNAYGNDDEAAVHATTRIRTALDAYARYFSADDSIVIVRAPGRVNIIGEHTDYNGFPVMPMAISRDVIIVASPRQDTRIVAHNVDPVFPPAEFTLERHIPPFESGMWANYIKSAMQGLIDYWDSIEGLQGMNIIMDGNVPLASGLSSSAAFTIAVATALCAVHKRDIPPLTFAEIMAQSDHYVGMASGGMDQTISLLGQAGKCLKIDFAPLGVTPVDLPGNTDIVVCHSRVEAAKAGNAKDAYNLRTVECRLATALLHALSPTPSPHEPMTLREWYDNDTASGAEASANIDTLLHENPYTVEEIAQLLQRTSDEIERTLCVTKTGAPCPQPPQGFEIKKRARHVISEAHRVESALALLSNMPDDAAESLGALMNASHASCRDDYHISCPELEEITDIARENGAYGARLTGAGFGGCAVCLVPKEATSRLRNAMDTKYYIPRNLAHNGPTHFLFSPVAGAGVLYTDL